MSSGTQLGTQQHDTSCYVAKSMLCWGLGPDIRRFWRHNTVCCVAGYLIGGVILIKSHQNNFSPHFFYVEFNSKQLLFSWKNSKNASLVGKNALFVFKGDKLRFLCILQSNTLFFLQFCPSFCNLLLKITEILYTIK